MPRRKRVPQEKSFFDLIDKSMNNFAPDFGVFKPFQSPSQRNEDDRSFTKKKRNARNKFLLRRSNDLASGGAPLTPEEDANFKRGRNFIGSQDF